MGRAKLRAECVRASPAPFTLTLSGQLSASSAGVGARRQHPPPVRPRSGEHSAGPSRGLPRRLAHQAPSPPWAAGRRLLVPFGPGRLGLHPQPALSSRGSWLLPHFLENLPRPPALSQQPSPHFRFSKHPGTPLRSPCNFPRCGLSLQLRAPGTQGSVVAPGLRAFGTESVQPPALVTPAHLADLGPPCHPYPQNEPPGLLPARHIAVCVRNAIRDPRPQGCSPPPRGGVSATRARGTRMPPLGQRQRGPEPGALGKDARALGL